MIFRHALLAAAITGLATTAYAQTTPTMPDTAPARPATSDSMKRSTPAPVAADAGKLIGRSVSNPQNEKIGKVESVYVTSDGKVDSVLVSVGGFLGIGDREVKLGWNDLQVMDNGEKVVVNMTKDELKAMVRSASSVSPYLFIWALPGSVVLLPFLAWFLDTRRKSRER